MVLKLGSKGDEVKSLQRRLALKVDGVFGPATEQAVKKWQSSQGLVADGVVGEITFKYLFPEASKQSSGPMSLGKLKGHIPDAVLSQIPEVIETFQINTPLRLCHFLAQCGHESAGFKIVNENLNYSTKGLLTIFKKYFPTEAMAREYERKPEKIANLVYGNRMGNGPVESGEGYKYRGRGFIQLTGKINYTAFDKVVSEDIVSNPDLVATKYPLLSAAWYWNSRSLNSVADKGESEVVVAEVTRKVNGGTIGLDDRIKHFKEYLELLS